MPHYLVVFPKYSDLLILGMKKKHEFSQLLKKKNLNNNCIQCLTAELFFLDLWMSDYFSTS